MRKIYTLILISTLIGCGDKSQNKIDTEQKTTVENKTLATNQAKDSKSKISCSNQNIVEWFGFDEAQEDPKCQRVSQFNLKNSYKCKVSKNAFGADQDAILLETQNQRIFIYSSVKDCNDILEIRNSNRP